MKKRNWAPLFMSILLVGLIGCLSLLRLQRRSIWEHSTVNFDMAIPIFYVVWILVESNVSVKELSQAGLVLI